MAIDWTQIPIVQKDMYDRWESFSLGHMQAAKKAEVGFKSPAVAGENVYGYDPVKDRVYNTINTYSLVGLVCPDKRDANFIFDGQLNVFGGGDNDPLGIVIAYAKMPNGDIHTLTVMRTLFGIPNANNEFYLRSPMTITKDLLTVAPKVIAESFGVLKFHNGRIVTADSPYVPSEEHNTGGSWRVVAPNGVHVRVVREQDIITVESSQINETELIPESKLTIDLSSDPDLAIFRGRSQYGFCSFSQDQVYWSGRVDHPKLATPFWLSDVHAMYGTEGKMSDAAEAGGVWTRDPVDLKEVFNSWMRVSIGNTNATLRESSLYSTNVVPSEKNAFTYDESTNRIGNPTNSSSVVGFVSPDKFDTFILDVTMKSSSNWQCDPVGIMVAAGYDPDGTFHTLHAIRSYWGPGKLPEQIPLWAQGPFCLILDYMTVGQKLIKRVNGGLRYASGEVATDASPNMTWVGDPGTMAHFEDLPNGVRVRLDRNGDYITLDTSQYNEKNFVAGARIAVDLRDHPELARFRKPCSYGFCSISQDNIWWEANVRPGGWRKPFWMSDFGKRNNYVRQVAGPFTKTVTSPGSVAAGYDASVYEPTNTPLDVLVPLRGFKSPNTGYTFANDIFVFGHHFKPEELSAIGLNADDGICIARPSSVTLSFITSGAGEVGYYIFNKKEPFVKRLTVKRFEELEMTSGIGIQYRLPQLMEDMIAVPYVKAATAVSNISVTIRNV